MFSLLIRWLSKCRMVQRGVMTTADERKPHDEPQDELQDKEYSPDELTDEQLDNVAGGHESHGAHIPEVTLDVGGSPWLGATAAKGAAAAGTGAVSTDTTDRRSILLPRQC